MNKIKVQALQEAVMDLEMIKKSINFYQKRYAELEHKRMRGMAGAGQKSVAIDRAIVILKSTGSQLSSTLLQARKAGISEYYLKVADELDAVHRHIQSLEKSQRKKVNVYAFSYEMLDEIKKRVTLLDMIEELHIVKRRSGKARYVIVCPFHDEKTPSCMIYVEEDKFHCFGCQENGDVIDFYQKYLELDFDEALERLVERLGIAFIDEDVIKNVEEEMQLCKDKIEEFTVELNQMKRKYYKEIAA